MLSCMVKNVVSKQYITAMVTTVLASSHLVDMVMHPTLLNLIRAVLAILLVATTFYVERPTMWGGFLVLLLLGAMQIVTVVNLPENPGYSPLFLLAPWVLYRAARNLQIPLRKTWLLAGFAAVGSYSSPLMWRIAMYPFGYGLKRITGMDVVVMLAIHWLLIMVVVLWGMYLRARERAAEQEKQRIRDEERALIAIEIHDILAHLLALIRMQASAGLYAPTQAEAALSTIQKVAGEGIADVRILSAGF